MYYLKKILGRQLATLLLLVSGSNLALADHWMGGEITWVCQGTGDYIFQLNVYRDCNGTSASVTQYITVWNHPTLDTIVLNQVSQNDISPNCTVVAGSPSQLTCAGGGAGAVEEFVYQSAPIFISGTPPAQGWVFSWDSYTRIAGISNTNGVGAEGITLYSKMYSNGGSNTNPCYDSSPQFPEPIPTPYYSGIATEYNQNSYDPDLDSLAFRFTEPLDGLIGVVSFNPPASPASIPWAAGYSTASPLPNTSHDPLNVPATLNSFTGEVTFTSFTVGTFALPVVVESWRCGILIAEVFREIIVVIIPAPASNNPPFVVPPFSSATSFNDTVYAGQTVIFNLVSVDNEFLHDGVTVQSNTLQPSGGQFGTAFNDPLNGCPYPPCATLSDPIPLTGSGGIFTTFSWQTDCDHLLNPATGCTDDAYTHTFSFRVTDDYCDIPGVIMPTVSITVLSPPTLNAPELKCASVSAVGDVTLNWIQPIDTLNSFDSYEVFFANAVGGPYSSIGTVPTYATTTFTHVGAGADLTPKYYYVTTNSGCGGALVSPPSDTLMSIKMNVNVPGNGTAQLSWNPLHQPNINTSSGWYHIYREYPMGTWTFLDSVAYGNEQYADTITFCLDTVNYRVEIADLTGCTSVSSIDGDWVANLLPPSVPEISAVTVDTATGSVIINWDQNYWNDTQGYIIMYYDGVNWIIIDTVWGITNTTYTDASANAYGQSETYGVAAFDSCWSGTPPSPNTSARGLSHNTIFLTSQLDVCAQEVSLVWNQYVNWPAGVQEYRIKAIENGGPGILIGTTTGTDTTLVHSGINANSTYCYVIEAVSNTGVTSLSNKSCIYIYQPQQATYGYLSVATVTSDFSVDVRYIADPTASVQGYRIERSLDPFGPYASITTIPQGTNPHSYTDNDVETQVDDYYYRAIVVDSCGNDGLTSNYNRTILLTVQAYPETFTNFLQWNPYEGWDGSITGYNIYRGIAGIYTLVGAVGSGTLYFEDDVSGLIGTTAEGEFCYYIEATESLNIYGVAEIAHSNVVCVYHEPLFWIPNAFVVNGVNNVFKPVANFIDFDSYYFSVFNRWGEMLWSTSNIDMGWDGTYNGKVVQEGAYVYMFSYRTAEGRLVEQRGTFIMLLGAESQDP